MKIPMMDIKKINCELACRAVRKKLKRPMAASCILGNETCERLAQKDKERNFDGEMYVCSLHFVEWLVKESEV